MWNPFFHSHLFVLINILKKECVMLSLWKGIEEVNTQLGGEDFPENFSQLFNGVQQKVLFAMV